MRQQGRSVETEYGTARPATSVPASRWAKMVGRFTAADGKSFCTVAGNGLLFFAGDHAGWAVSESPDGTPIDVKPGQFEPGPSTNRLYFRTKGTGTLKLRVYPDGIGAVVAAALAAAEAASVAAGGNVQPNKTIVKHFALNGSADQPYSPVAGTVYSVVTYATDNSAAFSVSDSDTAAEDIVIDDGSHVADAQANARFDGTGDILFHGTGGDAAIILQYVRA